MLARIRGFLQQILCINIENFDFGFTIKPFFNLIFFHHY
jgi:hypothetical protein